jgi:hypothetical protein
MSSTVGPYLAVIPAGLVVYVQDNAHYIVWRNITIVGDLILGSGSELVVL